MPDENLPKSSGSGEIKNLIIGLKDGLTTIRNLLVAGFALFLTLMERFSKSFAEWRSRSKAEEKELAEKRVAEEKAMRVEARKAEEQSKIAEELRAEERAMRAEERKAEEQLKITEERKAKEKKMTPRKFLYPFLAAISTSALVVGVARLAPIAKWTRSQNECIAKTSTLKGLTNENLADKVKRCNGGHD